MGGMLGMKRSDLGMPVERLSVVRKHTVETLVERFVLLQLQSPTLCPLGLGQFVLMRGLLRLLGLLLSSVVGELLGIVRSLGGLSSLGSELASKLLGLGSLCQAVKELVLLLLVLAVEGLL